MLAIFYIYLFIGIVLSASTGFVLTRTDDELDDMDLKFIKRIKYNLDRQEMLNGNSSNTTLILLQIMILWLPLMLSNRTKQ